MAHRRPQDERRTDLGPTHLPRRASRRSGDPELHAHDATDRSQLFDEFRPGLDHVSFGCADREQLELWQTRLDELGVKHGEIAEDANGFGLSFRDPDNTALEFWAPRS